MQFPLHVWVWPLPRTVRDWVTAVAQAGRHSERIAALLRKVRAWIDPDWVLGSLGWTALVYVIVHFGGTLT
jgi:hypothetical protein